MKNFYEILGVAKTASKEEIKKAFHVLAHKHHPDKPGGNEAEFKKCNEAYQTLSDDSKRSQYDMTIGHGNGFPFTSHGYSPPRRQTHTYTTYTNNSGFYYRASQQQESNEDFADRMQKMSDMLKQQMENMRYSQAQQQKTANDYADEIRKSTERTEKMYRAKRAFSMGDFIIFDDLDINDL